MSLKSKLFHFSLRHPRFATFARRMTFIRWRASMRWRKVSQPSLPDADAIRWVRPNIITKYVGGTLGDRYSTRGAIRDGDWDLSAGNFAGWDVDSAIRERYSDGKPWCETEYYKRAAEHIRQHGMLRGETKPEAVFERIDRLYECISNNGFKPMHDAITLDYLHWEVRDKLAIYDDVTVAIGRNGELILQDGKHRLAIAKTMKIPTIPVAVGVRHAEWVAFREEIRDFCQRRGSAYQPFTHPDLQDFPIHHRDDRDRVILDHLPEEIGSMLDLGAYFGYFCCYFAARGWKCTAVEHHPTHAYFIKKLAHAEQLPIDVLTMSLFDIPRPMSFNVVLALNIFHHYLKTKVLFEDLKSFLRSFVGVEKIFLETHEPTDEIMKDSFMNFQPREFADFVANETGLSEITELCETTRGRRLYMISAK